LAGTLSREKKRVALTVPAEKRAFWDEKTHVFVVQADRFDVMVGGASDDIRLTEQVQVK